MKIENHSRSPIAPVDRPQPEIFFTVIALIVGLILAFITPPFQAPDEPMHFYRIWQLSTGRLVADHYGGSVPVSLFNSYAGFARLVVHSDRRVKIADIFDEFHRPLFPQQQQYVFFPNTAIYSIVPYLPQTLAVFVGRQFALPPIVLMYVGRCANVVAYALLGSIAIQITPILKWPITLVLLAPLPLFLAGSLSADPMTLSLTFIATACALRLMTNTRPMPIRLIAIFALASVGVALCKWAYLPVVALVFTVPRPAWGKIARPWLLQVCTVACAFAAMAVWAGLSKPDHVPELNGNPTAQMHWILSHPAGYCHVLIETVPAEYKEICWTSIGVLGWLDARMSPWFIGPYLLLACWAAVTDQGEMAIPRAVRIVAFFSVLVSVTVVATCVYLVWDATGAASIEGIQGRYLLPLALLAFVIVRHRGGPKVPAMYIGLAISASCIYTIAAIIQRYYMASNGFL